MKQKLLAIIMSLFMIVTLVSCEKEKNAAVNNPGDISSPGTNSPETNPAENNPAETISPDTEAAEPAPEEAEEDTSAAGEPTDTADPSAVVAYKDADTHTLIVMDTPPFSYYVSDKAEKQESQPVKLNMFKKETNEITDEEEWFTGNGLSLNASEPPDSFQEDPKDLPAEIEQGLAVGSAFYDDSYIYCIDSDNYSEKCILNIYSADTCQKLYSLDFSSYQYSPEYVKEDYNYIQQTVKWAAIKDNILYVSNSHNTYAKSSNNMNAYITAIDLRDMSILWRTDALVCNSRNFQITGNVIICGYGFTAEDDFLYEVDMYTGKVIEKIPLVTAASYIIVKDDILYVRTYNTNYEFKIE